MSEAMKTKAPKDMGESLREYIAARLELDARHIEALEHFKALDMHNGGALKLAQEVELYPWHLRHSAHASRLAFDMAWRGTSYREEPKPWKEVAPEDAARCAYEHYLSALRHGWEPNPSSK